MDDNKITISWEELRTRQVEQRVSAMQAMRRNREYAQITDAAPEEPRKFKSLWYTAAVVTLCPWIAVLGARRPTVRSIGSEVP